MGSQLKKVWIVVFGYSITSKQYAGIDAWFFGTGYVFVVVTAEIEIAVSSRSNWLIKLFKVLRQIAAMIWTNSCWILSFDILK